MKAIFAIILLTTAAVVARADDLTIFGFELGKPLSLPECPYKTVGGSSMKLYEVLVSVTCIQDAHSLDGYGQPVREITFSPKECPVIVKNWRAFPLEVNGNLIGFHFLTRGIESQDIVMRQLQTKYGKPKAVGRRPVQNNLGAAFEAVDAQWQAGRVSVTFHSTRGRLDWGEVYIDLPAAVELRKSWEQSARSAERKM